MREAWQKMTQGEYLIVERADGAIVAAYAPANMYEVDKLRDGEDIEGTALPEYELISLRTYPDRYVRLEPLVRRCVFCSGPPHVASCEGPHGDIMQWYKERAKRAALPYYNRSEQ